MALVAAAISVAEGECFLSMIRGSTLCHFGLMSVPHTVQSFANGSLTLVFLKWTTLSPSPSTSSDLTVTAVGDTLELRVVGAVVEFPIVLLFVTEVEVRCETP